jgi:SpoIID/LytB domain protein
MMVSRTKLLHFDAITRVHALVGTCACVVILFLGFSFPRANWPAFNTSNNLSRDETEIDSALQEAATTALGQREGTIVIMDAHTGRVRASVNLAGAYTQAVMPGSTIKPFTTLAALRAGLIDEDSHTTCPGRFTGLSFSLPCVHADHLPPFTPSKAIAYSCNYYFATLGQRLGRDKLIETLRPFGFGQTTGLESGEATGSVKPCETGDRARIRSAAGDLASQQSDCAAREALGESNQIQVTPIQLLTAYAALLNGGHLVQPQVADADSFRAVERSRINVSSEEHRVISEGMAGAVRFGTARKAHLDSLPLYVLGKTGTALPAKGFRTNGWFVGLAGPAQSVREAEPSDIQLAVIVFLPRAHGADAAALSRPIFDAYANAVSRVSTSITAPPNEIIAADQAATRNSKSSIKVHLVTANTTQELSLEDYVTGVMQTEGSMEAEPEALKALAIAIRTYAVKNRGRHAGAGYDFCSTTHCQRFGVRSPRVSQGSEDDRALPDGRASDRIIAATRATEGLVLLDDHNQVVDSYFGASCGGRTANFGTLWGKTSPEYLRGVRDEFCVAGPHANWTDSITRADLLRALQSDTRTDVGGRLDQIAVSRRDETGRAEFITLEGEQHKSVRGWDFKIIVGRVLGWNVLKSSRFDVARSGSNFVFRGSGFGHGLGLCQEGAHVMAARGMGYERILEKYFPGTRVGRDAGTRGRGDPASSSLSTQWKSDVFSDSEPPTRPNGTLPRSGEMFIAHDLKKDSKLRRSGIFSSEHFGADSHFAPSELMSFFKSEVYKHSVPTGLKPAPRFITISSEHFRVTYPADVPRREVDQVLNVLEAARADFARRASAASIPTNIPTLEIRLNDSTGDFVGRTGQPWWAAAATKGNRIEFQPLPILKRRGVLVATLKHELAHVFIDVISRNRAPRWLEEGFAIYLAGEGRMFSHYVRRGTLPIDELEKRLERPTSPQQMRALYAEAYLTVNEIIRSGGESGVWKKVAES